MLLLMSSLTFVACTEQQQKESPTTLTLSQTTPLQLPYTASEANLSISASSEEWTALPEKDWVLVKKQGNQLNIKVSVNEDTRERNAKIQISLGSIVREVDIVQEGSPLDFSAQKEYEFGQFGGHKKFFVNASSADWTATATVPWLQVSSNIYQGEILVYADENIDRASRAGKIEIKDLSGKVVHALDIKQKEILYHFLPYPTPGVGPEVIRLFESERHSRLVNQPDMINNFNQWAYETVSPIFDYIMYDIKNGKYVGAKIFAKNRNHAVLKDEAGAEVIEFLRQNGYQKQLDVLYYHPETKCEVCIVTTSYNPNITFSYYPEQTPYRSFDKLPIGSTRFYQFKVVDRPDGDKDIVVLQEGDTADEILAYEKSQGWNFIPPYDPKDPKNAGDDYATQETKRDESSRKIVEPLFFGAKRANPEHWREFYNYLVFEKDGQYKAYELHRTYEEYINNYVDPSDPFYGSWSRRVSGTQMGVWKRTFPDPRMFMYESDGGLYVTKEFRKLLTEEGFFFDSTFDRGRAFVYFNPEKKLELSFRYGKSIVDGDNKPRVVIMQLVPRDPSINL